MADRSAASPVVFVVDDDIGVRVALDALICAEGWRCETFGSARAFLSRPTPAAPHCLILDINLSDFDSRDVQLRMAAPCSRMPVILLADAIPPALRAIKTGALELLIKPIEEVALLGAVENAIAHSAKMQRSESDLRELRQRYDSLSRREREVMDLVVSGLLNKQVGCELGISEITVKAHRGQVMQKMRARSFADLVTMSLRLL